MSCIESDKKWWRKEDKENKEMAWASMWYEHMEREQDKSQNYNQLEGGAEVCLFSLRCLCEIY